MAALPQHQGFDEFFRDNEVSVRHVLVARLGPERGREAAAEALLWALENWERVQVLHHPVRYLARVGTSKTRARHQAWLPSPEPVVHDTVEPDLVAGLASLSARQRQVVVLVCAYEWRVGEVADLLGRSPSSVTTHLRRGLTQLRRYLGVSDADLGLEVPPHADRPAGAARDDR